MPRSGRRRKKARTHKANENHESATNALSTSEELRVPKSLVLRRGRVEREVVELVDDLRRLMLPYTALHFKEDAKNTKLTLSHYAKKLAMPMGVSHIVSLSQKEERLNLRLARVPEGPTMTFRVRQFSLARHVKAIQRRPYNSPGAHEHPPIVVTNNFGDARQAAPPHVKLMRISFQSMFPAINVATVRLVDCRRVVLFHLLEEEEEPEKSSLDSGTTTTTVQKVEIRHYAIKATPVGVNRKVRRLIQTKVPNLNKLEDIADYITGTTASGQTAPSATTSLAAAGGNASDSEPEDEASRVVLPQKYTGRGNRRHQTSALKLVELGPRLCLQLLRVERGLGDEEGGDVMYHAHVTKTPEEIRQLKDKRQEELELKRERREEQERNVERKRQQELEKRQAKRQRREARENEAMEELRRGVVGVAADEDAADSVHEDDDDDEEEEEEVVHGDEQEEEESSDEEDV